jgi:hypothetical protein
MGLPTSLTPFLGFGRAWYEVGIEWLRERDSQYDLVGLRHSLLMQALRPSWMILFYGVPI